VQAVGRCAKPAGSDARFEEAFGIVRQQQSAGPVTKLSKPVFREHSCPFLRCNGCIAGAPPDVPNVLRDDVPSRITWVPVVMRTKPGLLWLSGHDGQLAQNERACFGIELDPKYVMWLSSVGSR
jgi:hypothetical protein